MYIQGKPLIEFLIFSFYFYIFSAVMVESNGIVQRINPKDEKSKKSILNCLLTPDYKEKGFQTVKIVSFIQYAHVVLH